MTRAKDITGKVFGRLAAVEPTDKKVGTSIVWRFRCQCGNESLVCVSRINSGNTQSCGCFQKEVARKVMTRHGSTRKGEKTPLYNVWANMMARCYNKNATGYENYGGRGIKVYHIWHVYENFREYMQSLQNCPKNIDVFGTKISLEIDRYPDNDGNYWPGNVRWATRKQQANNYRRNSIVQYAGRTMTLMQAVEEYSKVPYAVARGRINYGWPIKKAFETPVHVKSA